MVSAIESGWVAPAGPDLAAFEADLAAVCGTAGAVALASGTAGLHLALLTAGVGPGDQVMVPSLTFAATAFAVAYCAAAPVFVDCERRSWNIDPTLVVDELDRRAAAGTLPRALITVDLYGQCADHDPIIDACRNYDVAVIEDAAEAIGATYRGRPAGSLADLGILSFNGNKLITASGGGAVVGNDLERLDRIRYLATQARQPVVHYEHTEIGFNYRLSNLLAALGRAQLATLDERIADRRATRDFYADLFADVPGAALNPIADFGTCNSWLTCVTLDPATAPIDVDALAAAFAAANIECRPLWKPMHLQPVFAEAQMIGGDVSADLYAQGLTLPSNPNQPDFHQRVTTAVRAALGSAS